MNKRPSLDNANAEEHIDFSKDLLTDPKIRGVTDIAHQIVAVASSRSRDSAQAFLSRINHPFPAEVAAYGSYVELVADSSVDIVYVATPHSHHFQNCMLAFEHGKHVLCEKSLTVTAEQTRCLIEEARRRKLFLMEAMWTRFFPLSIEIRELVRARAIGQISRVISDLSLDCNSNNESGGRSVPNSHRLLDMDLAGGAQLDLGVYPINWIFQILYHTRPDDDKEIPQITACVQRHSNGADESNVTVLSFPGQKLIGVATSSFRIDHDTDGLCSNVGVCIQGSLGEIQIGTPASRPTWYKLLKKTADGRGTIKTVQYPQPFDEKRRWGHGTFWEADECARCIRDGKMESSVMPLSESLLIMEVLEQSLQHGGVKYPEAIRSSVYERDHMLNGGKRQLEESTLI